MPYSTLALQLSPQGVSDAEEQRPDPRRVEKRGEKSTEASNSHAVELRWGQLTIVGQISAQISRSKHCCQATALMQKDAPLDLLLGTDLLDALGVLVLETRKDGTAVDIVQTKKWDITSANYKDQAKEATLAEGSKLPTAVTAFFCRLVPTAESSTPCVLARIQADMQPARGGQGA